LERKGRRDICIVVEAILRCYKIGVFYYYYSHTHTHTHTREEREEFKKDKKASIFTL
jgi:hypothetical protein